MLTRLTHTHPGTTDSGHVCPEEICICCAIIFHNGSFHNNTYCSSLLYVDTHNFIDWKFMASASECMHKPGTLNTIIQELHPVALLYIVRGVRSHVPHQLVHGGSQLSDKIERRLFWAMSQ